MNTWKGWAKVEHHEYIRSTVFLNNQKCESGLFPIPVIINPEYKKSYEVRVVVIISDMENLDNDNNKICFELCMPEESMLEHIDASKIEALGEVIVIPINALDGYALALLIEFLEDE